MEGPRGQCVETCEGVHDLLVEQVIAYLCSRIMEIYTHFRTEVGEYVDRFQYISTRGAWQDYILGTSS
jgi:hypothetical protein